jgi:hypothetical protein
VAGELCDVVTGACANACTAAADAKQSAACDFYAVQMELTSATGCFAAFVTNTSSQPAHIQVEFPAGTSLPVAGFTALVSGTGANVAYSPYDAVAGLPQGQVAVVFLAGSASANVPCPMGVVTPATNGSMVSGTGMAQAFHITTDQPVSAYQMNPYGGGVAAVPGASLLLPTSAWDTNYVAVTAAPAASATMTNPSINIVAAADDTEVTILPPVAVVGGGTLPAGPANIPYTLTLNQGQQAQLSQAADLTGTVIQATKPIGVLAGNACMQTPLGTNFCDHGEQMLPPVKALGSEYVGVMFRPRVTGDVAFWRVVGVVNGTTLTYSSTLPGAPTTLAAGQIVTFSTASPFVVASQDASHPFMMFEEMTGGAWASLSVTTGYGDPDIVVGVPTKQFLHRYTIQTDPTFPETNLVVVRAPDPSMTFQDVTLDCAGVLTGWQAVGNYEWTRIDLTRHDFANQGSCSSGPHSLMSSATFGVSVWGWGSPETTIETTFVSYGYPGGMSVRPINALVIPPAP